MTKAEKKAANRTLAAALRAEGLTPNGEVWEDARDLVSQGLEPRAAARLVRATLPSHEQVKAIGRKRVIEAKGRATPAEVAQALTIEHAPVSQAPKRVSERAKEVAAGKVMRDAKGRLLSRDAQREIEETLEAVGARA